MRTRAEARKLREIQHKVNTEIRRVTVASRILHLTYDEMCEELCKPLRLVNDSGRLRAFFYNDLANLIYDLKKLWDLELWLPLQLVVLLKKAIDEPAMATVRGCPDIRDFLDGIPRYNRCLAGRYVVLTPEQEAERDRE